ncbi:MAG: 50S ribosomal protein L21 [Chlamydiia bacterium]|nr:50S ribosomal protein L21 [Chlamydiia bacterium]
MEAFIQTGGKQYRVKKGDIIDVELLGEETHVQFNQVLFLKEGQNYKVDPAHLQKCVVHGEVLGEVKSPKVIAFKYKKCKNYRRTVGHRQRYTRVKITNIAHG